MTVRDLLIEIGTEELPPLALKNLSAAFSKGVLKGLAELGFNGLKSRSFATPRRLAILVEAVPEQQAEQAIERRGPAVQAAFDSNGQPSKAALGFAKSCGVSVEQLSRLKTDKGEWLHYATKQAGKMTGDCVPGIVEQALAALPIPKRMRWGSGEAEFVRPVHWVVLLFGEQVIKANILDVASANQSFGHRFHHPDAITHETAAGYETALVEQAYVLPDFSARRQRIESLIREQEQQLKVTANLDRESGLLDEVTALVEWPVALVCSFDEQFLHVPAEALISTMKDNQKYFPLYDKQGRLTRNFVVISNLASQDPEQIRLGNERVVRPRLADAEFFWDQDRKQPLSEFNSKLGDVIFHRKLGTVLERVKRISKLAASIARSIGADEDAAARAGLLCKADLMTEMVFEFPKLQGVMGRYYALHSGESEQLAEAIEQHYWPRYAGDSLPEQDCAQCVALAEKLDSLLGIFAAGEKPSGVRDPFALRRAALGVIKILIEKQLALDLQSLLNEAAALYPAKLKADKVAPAVLEFILARLKAEYESLAEPFTPQQVAAVMAIRPMQPLDFDRRIRAVRTFNAMPQAESLAAANKRIANILKKAKIDKSLQLEKTVLTEAAEKKLYGAVEKLQPKIASLCKAGKYQEALGQLADLRDTVDQFFDQVMVMAEDDKLRNNRLALLQSLHLLFGQIADISLLQNQ